MNIDFKHQEMLWGGTTGTTGTTFVTTILGTEGFLYNNKL
jgi:hypothetical protein